MAYTLNYTDAATLLVVPRAQWNKGMQQTRESMKAIREHMPFPWLGAHPDTGSEFINQFVVEWCSILELVQTHFAACGDKENPPPAWPKPLRRGEGPRKF